MLNKPIISKKIIGELQKIPNIRNATERAGIDRSTYYDWKDKDPQFRKKTELAIRKGRENMTDIAEGNLWEALVNKERWATTFCLSRLSDPYMSKSQYSHSAGLDRNLLRLLGLRDAQISEFITFQKSFEILEDMEQILTPSAYKRLFEEFLKRYCDNDKERIKIFLESFDDFKNKKIIAKEDSNTFAVLEEDLARNNEPNSKKENPYVPGEVKTSSEATKKDND